jgi:hypothetical protein
MSHSYVLWIAVFAYALHIVEEYTFDWKGWAVNVLKLPVDWTHFALVNGAVIVLGVSCSAVGWSLPAYALSLPALMVINATFFHLLPFLATKGRFSPGLGTAVLLFYPISIWAFYGAYQDGVLSVSTLLISFVIGALLMAFPVMMVKLRLRPYFNQNK